MRFLAGGFVRSIGADSSRKLRSSPTLGIRRHLAPDVTFPADVRAKHHTSLTGLRFPFACGAEDIRRRRFTSSSRSDRVPIAFGLVHRAPPCDRDGSNVGRDREAWIDLMEFADFSAFRGEMRWIAHRMMRLLRLRRAKPDQARGGSASFFADAPSLCCAASRRRSHSAGLATNPKISQTTMANVIVLATPSSTDFAASQRPGSTPVGDGLSRMRYENMTAGATIMSHQRRQ